MSESEDINTGQSKSKRKLRLQLIAGAVVVLILAALVLTPPYVNVNRYRRRITTVMCQSLGRPVHLDNVTLHLLPMPGLTLSNLVVSEDPAFGYEPVIRANTVEATLRAGSLWRRQVEFSTIRFIDPSVNLVRSAQGKWNLEEVLMQASRVETAPTAQSTAGPAPRFPYIEATGARVNVKLGNEKMPFSLTEAQFALWLPSSQQWRVRMRGRPTRTDSNVSQAGEITLEGSLQRARAMSDVPLDIRATWNDAPLGEASRLLVGSDAGWRGTGFAEVRVLGHLSQAAIATHLQLNDLRRADFVPAQLLDVTVECTSQGDIGRATLTNVVCAAPVGETKPLTLTSPAVDLEKPKASQAKVAADAVHLSWALGWAKLFIPELPSALEPAGNVSGELEWDTTAGGWQGTLTAKLPEQKPDTSASPKIAVEQPQFAFTVNTAAARMDVPTPLVRLAPTALHPAPGSSLILTGQADAIGYGLQLTGTATTQQVESLAATLPPLNDGLAAAFPAAEEQSSAPHPVAISCSRPWGSAQMCVTAPTPVPPKPTRTKHRR